MPNPASVYCKQNGGTLEIRSDTAGNQSGVCVFSDGSECDGWAYFRGECAPSRSTPGSIEENVNGMNKQKTKIFLAERRAEFQ